MMAVMRRHGFIRECSLSTSISLLPSASSCLLLLFCRELQVSLCIL